MNIINTSKILSLLFMFALLLGACASEEVDGDPADAASSADFSSPCEAAAAHMSECMGELPNPPSAASSVCDETLAGEILSLECDALTIVTTDKKADFFNEGFASFACSIGLYRSCPIPACMPEFDEPANANPAPAPEGSSQCAIDALRYEGCGACEYYRCREETAQCGPDGYLMAFANRYCLAYRLVSEPEASPAAKVTLKKIRRCLVESIDRDVPGDDCDQIYEGGFASHPDCYIESGFCDLSVFDWFLVLNTIELGDFDFAQMLITGTQCLDEWFN